MRNGISLLASLLDAHYDAHGVHGVQTMPALPLCYAWACPCLPGRVGYGATPLWQTGPLAAASHWAAASHLIRHQLACFNLGRGAPDCHAASP